MPKKKMCYSVVIFKCKNCDNTEVSKLVRSVGSQHLGTTRSVYKLCCCEECMEEYIKGILK